MTTNNFLVTANQELAKILRQVSNICRLAEQDRTDEVKDWADVGARVYLLVKTIRDVLEKYGGNPTPCENPYVPSVEDVQSHVRRLFGNDAIVNSPGKGDFELCLGTETPLGALFLQGGLWTCFKMQYDAGNRQQPPEWYEVEIASSASYWDALYILAAELEQDRIHRIIESIGAEGA